MDINNSVQKYEKLTKQLNSDTNLQFIIRESDLEKAAKRSEINLVETVIKKAALYASKSVILTEPLTYFIAEGNPPKNAQSQWGRSSIAVELKDLFDEFHKNAAFNRVFCFVPEKLERSIESWYNQEEWITDDLTLFEFSKRYSNKLGVEMSFSDPTANPHILETLGCSGDEISVVNLWLPKLSNVPLNELLKLREDESDSFTRFQYTLKKLISDSEAIDSENKAKEIFERVDYEVRLLENKMQKIKKIGALKTFEAFVGLTVMGLCLALPSEVAKVVSSALGAFEGKEFINHLFHEREQVYDLKSSDFYIPWLCTKKGKIKGK